MKLDSSIQSRILESLHSCYPDFSTNVIREEHEEEDLANLQYLKELGLVNAALQRTLSGAFVFEGAAITAKGIDYLTSSTSANAKTDTDKHRKSRTEEISQKIHTSPFVQLLLAILAPVIVGAIFWLINVHLGISLK